MGEYYMAVNLDKKEYIHPHRLGEGAKIHEIVYCGDRSLIRALALLLADGASWSGRWKGDRVVLAGDYGKSHLYEAAREEFKDVTKEVVEELQRACFKGFSFRE